jgi:bisphosphoglycerate-independent phosphoglycerate mutase (AlkP superfamily)
MAAQIAEVPLKNTKDLFNREAISADFTAQGWRDHLGLHNTPILTPHQAGNRLARLAKQYHFSLFEYWLSDYVGHKRKMSDAFQILETFDQVLGGLLSEWDHDEGLILITSDHGNLEDLTIRNHTRNPVPAIVIGTPILRQKITPQLRDITDIYPAILEFLGHNDH